MAVINRTPDSFYPGARQFDVEVAAEAVARAEAEGADLVDIGGVKAGPGDLVDVEEELRRVFNLGIGWCAVVREAEPGEHVIGRIA
jgi:dihydropteroate synthase